MLRLSTKRSSLLNFLIVASAQLALSNTYAEVDERIVTIGGAATEIVFALGAGNSVVAADLSSIYPPQVRELPMVGYVRNISPEGVLSMSPDLVIATGALGPPTARKMLERLDIDIIWLPNLSTPEELLSSIKTVSERLALTEAANALIEQVNLGLAQSEANSSNWTKNIPSVLFLLEPPGKSTPGMGGGLDSKANTLIDLAGGKNAANRFAGFKPVSMESLVAMNPDIILVGQSDRHGGSPESIQAMIATPALSEVNAIKKDAVYPVPLDDLAFGPRLGEVALRWNTLLANHAAQDKQ